MTILSPTRHAFPIVPIALAVLVSACRTGAGTGASAGANESSRRGYVEADVRFVQGMIPHHAQAIVMADLVDGRTDDEAIHRLARRIEISQEDEIARMRRWLEARGEAVPDPDAHAHGPLMPGMLTREQMDRLAAASGPEFDRLFLELMIHHHGGALVMVEELYGSEGGGQEPELFLLASHIDADQRAEIARMEALLETMNHGGTE